MKALLFPYHRFVLHFVSGIFLMVLLRYSWNHCYECLIISDSQKFRFKRTLFSINATDVKNIRSLPKKLITVSKRHCLNLLTIAMPYFGSHSLEGLVTIQFTITKPTVRILFLDRWTYLPTVLPSTVDTDEVMVLARQHPSGTGYPGNYPSHSPRLPTNRHQEHQCYLKTCFHDDHNMSNLQKSALEYSYMFPVRQTMG